MKVLLSHITLKKKKFTLHSSQMPDLPEIEGGVTANLEIYALGEKYYASGTVNASVRLQCDLCLEEFSQELSEPIAVYISQDADESDDDFIPLRPNDVEIDFSDFIRDTLLLAFPIIRKCRPDCKGLDAKTGINLNYSEKPKEEDAIDPRWEKLKLIRSQLNQ
jgi:uncharacterized protein